MNYLDYYELAQEPFSNAPVSRFYFNSPSTRRPSSASRIRARR